MRWLLFALLTLLALLQYRLWFADGSLAERHRLEQQIEEQARINEALLRRNSVLEREVLELQSGSRGLEQRAREELGLIREGEVFYRFADQQTLRPALAVPGSHTAADAPTATATTPPAAPPAAEETP